MKNHLADIGALAVIGLAGLIFYGRLFWPFSQLIVTPDFGRSDAWHFSFSTKYFLGENLERNQIPLWSAQIGDGFPLFAEGQMGTFFIPNLILYKLFDVVTAYNLSLVVIVLMLGWGMYAWLRLLQLGSFSALFAGLTFAFSGLVIAQLPHVALLQGFSLMPWVMVATIILARRKSGGAVALFALLAAQQLLAGFPQASFISILMAVGFYLFLSFRQPTWLADLARLGLAFTLTLGLAAVQLLPSFEFLRNSTAARGLSTELAIYFSYPYKHLVTLLSPFALGNPRFGTYPSFAAFDGSIFWENTGYVGLLPILLIALAFLIRKQLGKSEKRFALALTVGLVAAFWLMTGSHSPLYLVYSFWPFNLFRVPSRFLWTFLFCWLALAALVLNRVWQKTKGQLVVAGLLAALVIANTVNLMQTWWNYHAYSLASEWLPAPALLAFVPKDARVYSIGAESAHSQWFLTQGWSQVSPYFFLRNNADADSNLLWHISQHKVYAGRYLLRPSIVENLLNETIDLGQSEATLSATALKYLNLFSINTILSSVRLTQTGLNKLTSVSQEEVTITAYDNPTASPRVYLASRVMNAKTVQEALAKINSQDFIPGESVLLEQPVKFDPAPTGAYASIRQESNHQVVIWVENLKSQGVLVLTDTYYPGWEATIDGVYTPVLAANIRQRAVMVPAGNHQVAFAYRPRSFTIGAQLSLATLLVTVGVAVFVRPVWRPRSRS